VALASIADQSAPPGELIGVSGAAVTAAGRAADEPRAGSARTHFHLRDPRTNKALSVTVFEDRAEVRPAYPRRRSAVAIATSTREVIPGTSTGRRPAT
jgi:hypothetical protein